jgi:hypothetical protein
MENDTFEFQNVANTAEIAASSSKMLHIALKTDRTGNKNNSKSNKQFRIHFQLPRLIAGG